MTSAAKIVGSDTSVLEIVADGADGTSTPFSTSSSGYDQDNNGGSVEDCKTTGLISGKYSVTPGKKGISACTGQCYRPGAVATYPGHTYAGNFAMADESGICPDEYKHGGGKSYNAPSYTPSESYVKITKL